MPKEEDWKDIELFAFDLDGTLLDTAPDFFKSVNILRQKYNLDEADYVQVRSLVSQGAKPCSLCIGAKIR